MALILDVLGLAQRSQRGVGNAGAECGRGEYGILRDRAREAKPFCCSRGRAIPAWRFRSARWHALKSFPVAQVEMSGSQWVTHVTAAKSCLSVRLNVAMEERRHKLLYSAALPTPDSGPIQGLGVATTMAALFGLVVERGAQDIVEDLAEVRSAATRASVLYSVLIGERVTELLDIPAILRSADLNVVRPVSALRAAEVAN